MEISNIVKVSVLSLCASILLYADEVKEDKKSIYKLDDIVVTANKMEENLQEVPQSITVIDKEIIEEKGIENIHGIVDEIPNMSSFSSLHAEHISFRGLNHSMFTNNNPVVFYIDGVPSINKYIYELSLANVERIEVLRGPQGTLYGKDAIGGVINIVTKEPTNEVSGGIALEHSKNNTNLGHFNINGPVVEDKLFFGLNAYLKKSDGWITNTLKNDDKSNKSEDKKYGAYLLYKATDNLSAKLSLSKYDIKEDGINSLSLQGQLPLKEYKRDKLKKIAFDVPSFHNLKIDSQALNVNYDSQNLKLSSITTHQKSNLKHNNDVDFGTNPIYTGLKMFNYQNNENWTQEFRLSNKSDKIKWITGLYFDKEKYKQNPYGMEMPMGAMGNMSMDAHSITNTKTQALFGQVIFPIMDKLDLTLGARYQRIKKDIDLDFYMSPVGVPAVAPAFSPLQGEKTWNVFLPKLALAYKYSDNLTPFVSISKGYMPGGFNYFATDNNIENNRFEAQQSINYELGVKGDYEDLIFTTSVFRMDIKDIHIYKQKGMLWLTDNAKKAHSQGIEFDFNYFPINEFEISGGLGLIDAKYDDYDAGDKRYDGEKIENTPKYTANLSLAYYDPSGYYGRVDLKALGETSFFNAGYKKFENEGEVLTSDLKIGYRINNFDIYGFVKNITDEKYITSYMNKGDIGVVSFNDPRTFGLGLKYKF